MFYSSNLTYLTYSNRNSSAIFAKRQFADIKNVGIKHEGMSVIR